MAPKSKQSKLAPEVSPAQEHEEDEQTDSESEAHDLSQAAGSSTRASASSSKKKKKKKSKMSKAINAMKGQSEIPDEIVHEVLDKVKLDGGVPEENLTVENIREALKQLKIMDVVQGKAGIGGTNQKDMGEHKVSFGVRFAALTY
jgi:glycylpeptide N-tetradecanoyltransferase